MKQKQGFRVYWKSLFLHLHNSYCNTINTICLNFILYVLKLLHLYKYHVYIPVKYKYLSFL